MSIREVKVRQTLTRQQEELRATQVSAGAQPAIQDALRLTQKALEQFAPAPLPTPQPLPTPAPALAKPTSTFAPILPPTALPSKATETPGAQPSLTNPEPALKSTRIGSVTSSQTVSAGVAARCDTSVTASDDPVAVIA